MADLNIRDGRILTAKSLDSDYTINLTKVDDGKIRISNNLKYINEIEDIGGGILRKVDCADTLPNVADRDSTINAGYPGRVFVVTGDTGTYQKGCTYRCVDNNIPWNNIFVNASTSMLKFELSTTQTFGVGDHLLICNSAQKPKSLFYYKVAGGKRYIVMASGFSTVEEAESSDAQKLIIYESGVDQEGTEKLFLTGAANQIVCNFNGCYVKEMSESFGEIIRVHINSSTDPVPAFKWELCTPLETRPVDPYRTVHPEGHNVRLSNVPTCFDFGTIEGNESTLSIMFDTSDIDVTKYNNQNIIYLKAQRDLDLDITRNDYDPESSNTFDINVKGDEISVAGIYSTLR